MRKIIGLLRKKYYSVKRKRLENSEASIISSDCFGTFVSHNLGLRFNSPTVNLFFPKEDFFEFVSNLEAYLKCYVTPVADSEVNYPVGKLTLGEKSVRINFMHYKSFEEAREKWNERKKRVKLDNIYIIFVIADATEEDIARFDDLNWKNKMLITKKNLTGSPNVAEHKLLKNSKKPGAILFYRHCFSLRRPMDKIDYVSFLNREPSGREI